MLLGKVSPWAEEGEGTIKIEKERKKERKEKEEEPKPPLLQGKKEVRDLSYMVYSFLRAMEMAFG